MGCGSKRIGPAVWPLCSGPRCRLLPVAILRNQGTAPTSIPDKVLGHRLAPNLEGEALLIPKQPILAEGVSRPASG